MFDDVLGDGGHNAVAFNLLTSLAVANFVRHARAADLVSTLCHPDASATLCPKDVYTGTRYSTCDE